MLTKEEIAEGTKEESFFFKFSAVNRSNKLFDINYLTEVVPEVRYWFFTFWIRKYFPM
jgi:hypothetical protein